MIDIALATSFVLDDAGGPDHHGTTVGAVLGVAAVAAVASCEHACDLVRAHGEAAGLPVWSRAGRSYRLLMMMIIRGARVPAGVTAVTGLSDPA